MRNLTLETSEFLSFFLKLFLLCSLVFILSLLLVPTFFMVYHLLTTSFAPWATTRRATRSVTKKPLLTRVSRPFSCLFVLLSPCLIGRCPLGFSSTRPLRRSACCFAFISSARFTLRWGCFTASFTVIIVGFTESFVIIEFLFSR